MPTKKSKRAKNTHLSSGVLTTLHSIQKLWGNSKRKTDFQMSRFFLFPFSGPNQGCQCFPKMRKNNSDVIGQSDICKCSDFDSNSWAIFEHLWHHHWTFSLGAHSQTTALDVLTSLLLSQSCNATVSSRLTLQKQQTFPLSLVCILQCQNQKQIMFN